MNLVLLHGKIYPHKCISFMSRRESHAYTFPPARSDDSAVNASNINRLSSLNMKPWLISVLSGEYWYWPRSRPQPGEVSEHTVCLTEPSVDYDDDGVLRSVLLKFSKERPGLGFDRRLYNRNDVVFVQRRNDESYSVNLISQAYGSYLGSDLSIYVPGYASALQDTILTDFGDINIPVMHVQRYTPAHSSAFSHEAMTVNFVEMINPLVISQLNKQTGVVSRLQSAQLSDVHNISSIFHGGIGVQAHVSTGTRGLPFLKSSLSGEHIFCGNAVCYRYRDSPTCSTSWFMQQVLPESSDQDMHFLFFYTLKLDAGDGLWKISRLSSCFQPADEDFHYRVTASGLAAVQGGQKFIVSYGRDDNTSMLTAYTADEIDTMLISAALWTVNNYVFHPNYSNSMLTDFDSRHVHEHSMFSIWNTVFADDVLERSMYASGLSLSFTAPRFNPSIMALTDSAENRFLTIAVEPINALDHTEKAVLQELHFSLDDSGQLIVTFQGPEHPFNLRYTDADSADPRFICDDEARHHPLLMVHGNENSPNEPTRRMRLRLYDLLSNTTAQVMHPLCQNVSENRTEKNWSPFYYQRLLHFVYSVDPLKVIRTSNCADPIVLRSAVSVDIECDTVSTWPMPPNLRLIFDKNRLNMRGGTPGLCIGPDEYLFVGHSVTIQQRGECFPDYLVQAEIERATGGWYTAYPQLYCMFFYTIKKPAGDTEWKLNRLSCCSHLPGKQENFTKIVFPCGLTRARLAWDAGRDSYIVSYGERDKWCNYCAMSEQFIQFLLRPVEQWTLHNYIVDVNYFNNAALLNPGFKMEPFRTGGCPVRHNQV
jgi:hypothetical protein